MLNDDNDEIYTCIYICYSVAFCFMYAPKVVMSPGYVLLFFFFGSFPWVRQLRALLGAIVSVFGYPCRQGFDF